MLLHLDQRSERIRTLPFEGASSFKWERFRQHEHTVAEVDETECRGDEKRRSRTKAAKQSADRWAHDEAGAERSAHDSEILCAPFRRADVGDVRIVGRERRARRTGDGTAGK